MHGRTRRTDGSEAGPDPGRMPCMRAAWRTARVITSTTLLYGGTSPCSISACRDTAQHAHAHTSLPALFQSETRSQALDRHSTPTLDINRPSSSDITPCSAALHFSSNFQRMNSVFLSQHFSISQISARRMHCMVLRKHHVTIMVVLNNLSPFRFPLMI